MPSPIAVARREHQNFLENRVRRGRRPRRRLATEALEPRMLLSCTSTYGESLFERFVRLDCDGAADTIQFDHTEAD